MRNYTGEKFNSLIENLFYAECIIIIIAVIVLIQGWFDNQPALLLVIPVAIFFAWLKTIVLIMFGNLCADIHKIRFGEESSNSDTSTTQTSLPPVVCCICGEINPNGAKYCAKCGEPLANDYDTVINDN